MKKNLATAFVFLALMTYSFADEAQTPEKQVAKYKLAWYDFTETMKINSKWSVIANVIERHYFDPVSQYQSNFRVYGLYNFGEDWSGGAGLAYFIARDNDLNVPEFRPEQWFFNKQKFSKCTNLTISHRYKIEEKLVRKTSGGELADGYSFNMRFRYRLGFDYILFKVGKDKNPFKALVNAEVFVNAGKNIVNNVFDQSRVYAGFSFKPVESFTVAVAYMDIFKSKKASGHFENANTLRISFEHEFSLKKKKPEEKK